MADLATILAESGLVSSLYGEEGAAAAATGEATALSEESQGASAEAGQYQKAAAISSNNATIALVSGGLEQYVQTRQLQNTLGAQRAGVAGGGFQESGSAVDLARSSLQQGLLQNQVIGLNANMQAGGYLEQAQASEAEATAAQYASSAEAAQSGAASQVAGYDTTASGQIQQYLNAIPGATDTINAASQPGGGTGWAPGPQQNFPMGERI